MYVSYYQLASKPFQISTDPKFLWLGEKHKEAMAVLRYGVMDNKGFLLLTGEVGTGKTTLINALVNTLGDEVLVATILDPGLEKEDFYNYIISAFNLPEKFSSKGEFIKQFSAFLNHAHGQRKKVLLIIDEAQRLNQMLLEEIRLLSNIERQTTKLINIFFVGQKEFNGIILQPKNRALRQRITVNYDLKPLSQQETSHYINYRLKVAGAGKTVFKSGSVREIYKFSKGYPRLINVICDRALLTGFTRDEKTITPKIIRECAAELTLKTKKVKSSKSPVPEKTKTKVKNAGLPPKSKSRYIENALYVFLSLLIITWIGVAAFFYYPKYVADTSSRKMTADQIVKREPVALQEDLASEGEDAIPVPQDPAGADLEKTSASSSAEPADEKPIALTLFPDKYSVIHIELTEQNELNNQALKTLTVLAQSMTQDTNLEILIKGYAGEGTSNYRTNKKMSEFTANIVKGYLVGKGISPSRVETTGVWLVNPEAGTSDRAARQNTRWVEIQLKNS